MTKLWGKCQCGRHFFLAGYFGIAEVAFDAGTHTFHVWAFAGLSHKGCLLAPVAPSPRRRPHKRPAGLGADAEATGRKGRPPVSPRAEAEVPPSFSGREGVRGDGTSPCIRKLRGKQPWASFWTVPQNFCHAPAIRVRHFFMAPSNSFRPREIRKENWTRRRGGAEAEKKIQAGGRSKKGTCFHLSASLAAGRCFFCCSPRHRATGSNYSSRN